MDKTSTKTKHSLTVMSLTREQIQESYIQWDLNQMSIDDLKQFFIDTQNRELNDLDDDELIEEVKQFMPLNHSIQ